MYVTDKDVTPCTPADHRHRHASGVFHVVLMDLILKKKRKYQVQRDEIIAGR